MEGKVFLNGEFLDAQDALALVLESGLLSGWGLFETMRYYQNKIVGLGEHLERIQASSKTIGIKMPFTLARLKGVIKKTVQLNGFSDTRVRLTIWRQKKDPAILVSAEKYIPYPRQRYAQGFKLAVSRFTVAEDSFLAGLKSTSRLLYELSFKEAQDRGFDEAIILNNSGYLAEASRSNLFLVKGKTLFTPGLSCGCLKGITRGVVIKLAIKYSIKIKEGNFTLQDLYHADEAFLTNSLMGVMPVRFLEDQSIGKKRCGELTNFFIQKYSCLLK